MIRILFAFMKRNLCKPTFTLLLLLFPIMLIVGIGSKKENDDSVIVCLYDETNLPFQQNLLKELENTDSMFQFVTCVSKEECKELVSTRQAECAFVFEKDLEQAFLEDDWNKSVDLYLSPATSLEALASERVYTAIFAEITSNHFQNSIKEKFGEEIALSVPDRIKKYETNGSTFAVNYQYFGEKTSQKQPVSFPIRGIYALLLYLYGLMGLLAARQNQEKHILEGNPYQKWMPAMTILAYLLPTGVLTVIGLTVARKCQILNTKGFLSESFGILWYVLVLLIYQLVLYLIMRRSIVITAVIPILLMVCVVVCPVFFSFGSMIKMVGLLEKLFPVTWYMRLFL